MAIYIQGVPTYQREPTMFTPEYDFLSTMLSGRTNKFNTNFKKVNDLYGSVVYADLTRPELIAARDKFVEKLPSQIEKISGLDLSLQQNVDLAQNVFQPFFDNEYIMGDMIKTKKIKEQINKMNELKNHPDPDVRSRYWKEGAEVLNYWYKDYIEAPLDEAMKMNPPTYTENVDLVKMADDYLTKMGYKDASVQGMSSDGRFIVTYKNGKALESTAYQALMKRMMNDPKIQAAYFTKYDLESRRYAEQAVQTGQAVNIQDGKKQWGKSQIQASRNQLAAVVPAYEQAIKQAQTKLDKRLNYLKSKNIGENHPYYQEYLTDKNSLDLMKAELQNSKASLDSIDQLLEDPDMDFSIPAVQQLMSIQLKQDLGQAASLYANKNATVSMEPEPYVLKEWEHNLQKDALKYASQLRKSEMILKSKLNQQEAYNIAYSKKKAELDAENEANKTANDYVNSLLQLRKSPGETTKNVNVVSSNAEAILQIDRANIQNKVDATFEYMFNSGNYEFPKGVEYRNGFVFFGNKRYTKDQIKNYLNDLYSNYDYGAANNGLKPGNPFGGNYTKPRDGNPNVIEPVFSPDTLFQQVENYSSKGSTAGLGKKQKETLVKIHSAVIDVQNGSQKIVTLNEELANLYETQYRTYIETANARQLTQTSRLIKDGKLKSPFQNGRILTEDEWIELNYGTVRYGGNVDKRRREKYQQIFIDLNKTLNGEANKNLGEEMFQTYSVEGALNGDPYSYTTGKTAFSRNEIYSFGTIPSPQFSVNIQAVESVLGLSSSEVVVEGSISKDFEKLSAKDQLGQALETYYNSLIAGDKADKKQSLGIEFIPGAENGVNTYKVTINSEEPGRDPGGRVFTLTVPTNEDASYRPNELDINSGSLIEEEKEIAVNNGGIAKIYKEDGVYKYDIIFYKVNDNGDIYLDYENAIENITATNSNKEPLNDSEFKFFKESTLNLLYDIQKQNITALERLK